jgi:hypothetical protein
MGEDLSDRIAYVKSMLAMMSAEMECGNLPGQSVAELQGTVDSVRRTAWSLLTSNADYRGCLGTFRVRRTTEACRRSGVFLLTRPGDADPSAVHQLATTLRDLLQAMDVSRRLSSGAKGKSVA